MNFTGICQRARIKLIIVIISLNPLTGRAEIVYLKISVAKAASVVTSSPHVSEVIALAVNRSSGVGWWMRFLTVRTVALHTRLRFRIRRPLLCASKTRAPAW